MKITVKWFRINSQKANPGKFQFMILGRKPHKIKLKLDSIAVSESDKVELPGITI